MLGAGRSGLAAARLARREGAEVTVRDDGPGGVAGETRRVLEEEGIAFREGASALDGAALSQLAVVSPGIDLKSPLARVFLDADVPVMAEIEFADCCHAKPVIAITGTNGKTTTTEMVELLLTAGGQRSVAAGNYGRAYSDLVLASDFESVEVVTLEVSSFQLEAIIDFRPDVSVWLNFAPDHLDRYAGVEEYYEAKHRIFKNQTGEDYAVVNSCSDVGTLRSRTVTFSAEDTSANYHLENGQIWFEGEAVCDWASGTRLRGEHNAENLMAALAVGHIRGIPFATMEKAIAGYAPPPHRCELVGTVSGHEYINDSKATNLHALEQSLRSQGESVVLIAGGKDKGLPFERLKETVKSKVSHVVAIGEIRDSLVEAWSGSVPCEAAESLEEAVRAATAAATADQTILFSPGTSSFDMFRGYEARGDMFRDIVNKLQ